jgi:hypothetical protein
MADWDERDIMDFAATKSGERSERAIEGPAVLGIYTVWRAWTYDGHEYHAHYVIAEEGRDDLIFKRDFQPFANWLMRAFNAKDMHGRRLDWFRSGVAAVIILALLGLVLWAVTEGKATGIDYRWLVGALAATSIAYLLGAWTRRT